MRGTTEFRHRQRFFPNRIQNVRHVPRRREGEILGDIRRYHKIVDAKGVLSQREILPDRKRFIASKAAAKADAADVGRGVQRRDLTKSGELGLSIMGIPFARSSSILEVKEKNDVFKESYFRAGHKEAPDIIVALHVYLHENEESATTSAHICYQRVLEYLGRSRRPGAKVPDFDTVKKEKLVVFSSPERAAEIFREYENIGVTHVICMVNFGGVPMPDVRRTLELMSKEIFPKFH